MAIKKSSKTAKPKATSKAKASKPVNLNGALALVVVEAPGKVQKIQAILGPNYVVAASVGHIMDLPKKGLGVDLDDDYAPTYEVLENKVDVVSKLKALAEQVTTVFLAADEDREGEFIAYSVAMQLQRAGLTFHRVTYNAITKSAILAAFQSPRMLDKNLVRAQQSRRVLDRLVGFKASPLLWNTIQKGLSAGRVQSVALRLIVDRQAEIDAFVPRDYWTIKANLVTAAGEPVVAEIDTEQPTEVDANNVIATLTAGQFKVKGVDTKLRSRAPFAPFTTSQMLQQASTILGWGAKRTTMVAQQLYEAALTTYIRTDSTFIDPTAVTAIRGFVTTAGPRYLPGQPNTYTNKGNAQEAHEAIRPVDVNVTPQSQVGVIPPDQQALYELVWRRAVGSQSVPAEFQQVVATIENNKIELAAKGQTMIFDGFLKFWTYSDTKELVLPKLANGDVLTPTSIEAVKHTTKPPARFNTASIVKELEENGVGRPSTYPAIIDTLLYRKYVSEDGKALAPTPIGKEVVRILKQHAPRVVDIAFTAEMEAKLDDVASGAIQWVSAIDHCWKPLEKEIADAGKTIVQTEVETNHKCAKCQKPLVRKVSSGGPFYACTDRTACGTIYQIGDDGSPIERVIEKYTEPCRTCGGDMIKRNVRATGVQFWGCSNYQSAGCKTSVSLDGVWKLPVEQVIIAKCDKCKKGQIILRHSKRDGKGFGACNNFPKCRNTKSLDENNKIIDKK